jgi:hypothetical protein
MSQSSALGHRRSTGSSQAADVLAPPCGRRCTQIAHHGIIAGPEEDIQRNDGHHGIGVPRPVRRHQHQHRMHETEPWVKDPSSVRDPEYRLVPTPLQGDVRPGHVQCVADRAKP